MIEAERVVVVLLAAGLSTRFGSRDKLAEPLGDLPLGTHAARTLGRTTLVEDDLRERRLVRPFGPELECSLAYHVVCLPQDADDPTTIAFREWLLKEEASLL